MTTVTKWVLTYTDKKIMKWDVDVTENLQKLSQSKVRFESFIKQTFGAEALEDYLAE